MAEQLSHFNFALPLPQGYRVSDILPFHQRDASELAERVSGQSLTKGFMWREKPTEIELRFDKKEVQVSIRHQGIATAQLESEMIERAQRMCGLTQPIERFADEWAGHHELESLFTTGVALRFALTPTVFEALSWAVTSQQISVKAAVKLRHRLIHAGAQRSVSGLYCYPDAKTLKTLSREILFGLGLPMAKVATLERLSEFALSYPLDELEGNSEEDMQRLTEALLTVKGIGPWTINYGLLRGYGYLDGSLHGDIALRRALQILWQHPDDVTEKQAAAWLNQFRPWRALVAAYLWQYTGA